MDFYEELLYGIKPLERTVPWLIEQGKLVGELTLYQQEYIKDPLTGMSQPYVRCICSACTTRYYADKISAGGCANAYVPAPFGFFSNGERVISGDSHLCPYCGEKTKVYYSGRMRAFDSTTIDSCYVAELRRIGDRLCIAEWWMKKECDKEGHVYTAYQPTNAYVMDGKKLVRMAGMQRNAGGGWQRFPNFMRRKNYVDMIARVEWFAPWQEDVLIGTAAENSKLDEYVRIAMENKVDCVPVSYLRAWMKYPNIENLISSGAGKILAQIVEKEFEKVSGYCRKNCKRILTLQAVDLKKTRPSEMLGLTTEEFRIALRNGWGWESVKTYKRLRDLAEAYDLHRDMPLMQRTDDSAVREMREFELKVIPTMRYLEAQQKKWYFLKDYYAMARAEGARLDRKILLYPKNLQQVHDELVLRSNRKAQKEKIEAFAAASKKYEYLQWTDKELCIILPRYQEDLIREGNVLQHCVGGYVDSHIKGKIILFVRHYRRPERSFYTLNIDMTGEMPKRIQLHGYGNERHGENMQYKHAIPKKVLDFVARWEREVLLPQWAKRNKKGA